MRGRGGGGAEQGRTGEDRDGKGGQGRGKKGEERGEQGKRGGPSSGCIHSQVDLPPSNHYSSTLDPFNVNLMTFALVTAIGSSLTRQKIVYGHFPCIADYFYTCFKGFRLTSFHS